MNSTVMREVLFREKRKDNGEWIEGYVFELQPGQYMICDQNEYDRASTFPVWEFFRSCCHEVDPETLCQYTGFNDKNGNWIWGNDICEMTYDGRVYTYVIVWDTEELDFKGTNGKEKYGNNFEYMGCCEEIVRIGNIFDNLELLKEQ